MNYRELTDSVAQRIGDPKAQTARVIDMLIEEIAEQLGYGEEISLPGLGKFKLAHRPARDGSNPQTGEKIKIAAQRRVKFAAAKALKMVGIVRSSVMRPEAATPPAPMGRM